MIKATNLWFGYSDEKDKALKGINFTAQKGEFIAVLGSNGCGKSTLAKHFNAILLPEKGEVKVDDMLTTEDEKLFDIRQSGKVSLRRWHMSEDLILNYLA